MAKQPNKESQKMVWGEGKPDKTNIFLQALFRAATSGVDTVPYVKKILGVEDDNEDNEEE